MAKIIRHHKESGYITAVKYQATIDAQNQPDWIMYLAPGPRAHAEFAAAHGGRKIPKAIEFDAIEIGDRQLKLSEPHRDKSTPKSNRHRHRQHLIRNSSPNSRAGGSLRKKLPKFSPI